MEPFNPQARFEKAKCLFRMEEQLSSSSGGYGRGAGGLSEMEREERAEKSRSLIESALVELQKVCDYAPRERVTHTTMAKYLKRLGRLDEAMYHYTAALDLDPKKGGRIKANIENLHSTVEEDDEAIREIHM
jgi:tetratricopeptide (TPR) repeat protein